MYCYTYTNTGEQTVAMKSAWQKTREDRILVDHLLRQGHYSAASKLAQTSGTKVGLLYLCTSLSSVCQLT